MMLILLCFGDIQSRELHAQGIAENDSLSRSKKDVIDVLRQVTGLKPADTNYRSNKKVQFSLVPAANNVPGGGVALLTSTNLAFRLGPSSTTSLSSIYFTPYFTFSKQVIVPIRGTVFLRDNQWSITADLRYMYYPQYSWGLGGNSPQENPALIDYHYFRTYVNVMKNLKHNLYFGGGYNMDYHYNIKVKENYISDTIDTRTVSSGFTINLTYDGRRNFINPQGGFYASIIERINRNWMGSDKNWESIWLDLRKYFSFSKTRQNTLAFWSYYWAIIGDANDAPYLDLPSIGWDSYGRSGRGYKQNRYRSNQLLYFEAEYRRDITNNGLLGLVLFSNLHSVSEYHTSDFAYWHPAGGFGLRLKFNKFSNTNICIDYGFSNTFNGIYLGLGEAF
ncbi:BamA/TamA family outer membrane protein [Taibaiella soli]|uniref:Bacterial surface antigen (D15) domain-containing protein n=1 Tax=Taibaiella soli TaxID=1649169 RepID=A0A2W2BIB9_9BACT|nr:hypothetical protein [Taibaiella soli]PZF73256.1 hypothetical protein DN068_08780 [Taibaiella soli]